MMAHIGAHLYGGNDMKKTIKVLSAIFAICLLFTACQKGDAGKKELVTVKAVEFIENVPDESDEVKAYATDDLPDLKFYDQLKLGADDLAKKNNAKVEIFAQEGWPFDCQVENPGKPYTYTLKASKDGEVKMFHYLMKLTDNGTLVQVGTYDENGKELTLEELNERWENLF